MAFIRRGYVPRNIPVTRSAVFSERGVPLIIACWKISCFEEYDNDTNGRRYVYLYDFDGRGRIIDQSFDTIAAALQELVILDDEGTEPCDIGVQIEYAPASPRKGA